MTDTPELQPTVTLHPKRSSAIRQFLGSIVFFGIGVWMAVTAIPLGYLVMAFGALGLLIFSVQLHPGSTYLKVDRTGFVFCNLFRQTGVPWTAVEEFLVVDARQIGVTVHQMVGFNFVESYDKAKLGRRVASAIACCEGALPDTYGMKAEDLARFMNQCLILAKQGAGGKTGVEAPERLIP